MWWRLRALRFKSHYELGIQLGCTFIASGRSCNNYEKVRIVKNKIALLGLLTGVISISMTAIPVIAASPMAITPLPSDAVVASAIESASNSSFIPITNSIPSLTNSGTWWTSINPTVKTDWGCIESGTTVGLTSPITNCVYGDPQATRTLVVYGDSNAIMWLPAFDSWGYLNQWRIVAIVHYSCSPWNRPWEPPNLLQPNGVSEGICRQWRKNAMEAIKTLQPTAVAPIGIENGINNNPNLPHSTMVQIASAVAGLITAFKSEHIATVLLQPAPEFPWASSPSTCLSRHNGNSRSCDLPSSIVSTQQMGSAFARAAVIAHIYEIPTVRFFCGPVRCPVLVTLHSHNYLIYADGYHLSLLYTQQLGEAMAPLISKDLG